MSDADTSEPEASPEPEVDAEPVTPEPADAPDDPTPAADASEDRTELPHELEGDDGPADAEDQPELLSVPPPDDPEVAARIEAGLAELSTKIDDLAGVPKGIDELVRLTRRSDEHVAELHAENTRLRAGELAGATAPMLRDLVRLHDEVTQLLGAAAPEATSDLELVRSRLLDTLARWGLAPFSAEVGDAMDPKRHQGVGRVRSADGAPGTVATVRKPGFAHDDGRTFRAAEVEVFQAPPEPEPPVPASSGQEDPAETTQERDSTDAPPSDETTEEP